MDVFLRRQIRETYKAIMPIIMQSRNQIDPYVFNFTVPMTPIERNVWDDIRNLGLPFYMQFPVGPYFIDFADPIRKIGIEVDGKEWHLDINADMARENKLTALGWKIVRIPGYKTFRQRSNFCSDEEYFEFSSRGDLVKLKKRFYDTEKKVSSELTPMHEVVKSVVDGIIDRAFR